MAARQVAAAVDAFLDGEDRVVLNRAGFEPKVLQSFEQLSGSPGVLAMKLLALLNRHIGQANFARIFLGRHNIIALRCRFGWPTYALLAKRQLLFWFTPIPDAGVAQG